MRADKGRALSQCCYARQNYYKPRIILAFYILLNTRNPPDSVTAFSSSPYNVQRAFFLALL